MDRQSGIYTIDVLVRYPSCGGKLKRYTDRRRSIQQKWTCKRNACKTTIDKADNDLVQDIIDLMNLLIVNPNLIQCVPEENQSSAQVRKLEREIEKRLDTSHVDRDALRQMIQECVSMKYSELSDSTYTAHRLKNEFARVVAQTSLPTLLFQSTVKELLLDLDGAVSLVLDNDQIIRRNPYAASSTAEKIRAGDPANGQPD